jgi:hypothetical protein
MLLRAQGKLHHPFEQMLSRKTREVVQHQLLGIEPYVVAQPKINAAALALNAPFVESKY